TDDAVGLARIGPGDVAGLVDEGQRDSAQRIRPVLGDLDAAGIGRDHGEIARILVLDVAGEDRHRDEVVDRTVEDPWICAVWRSTAMIRSAPAVLYRSATRRAE